MQLNVIGNPGSVAQGVGLTLGLDPLLLLFLRYSKEYVGSGGLSNWLRICGIGGSRGSGVGGVVQEYYLGEVYRGKKGKITGG